MDYFNVSTRQSYSSNRWHGYDTNFVPDLFCQGPMKSISAKRISLVPHQFCTVSCLLCSVTVMVLTTKLYLASQF